MTRKCLGQHAPRCSGYQKVSRVWQEYQDYHLTPMSPTSSSMAQDLDQDSDAASDSSSSSSSRPPGLPSSPYFALRSTPHAGRGLFATQRIPAETPLFTADDLTARIIYREYRREVCMRCFAYDRGVSWPLRDPTAGLVFCSKRCRKAWLAAHDRTAVKAHEAVNTLMKNKLRKGVDDEVMLDVSGSGPPSQEHIERAWKVARNEGRRIVAARTSLEPTKAELKSLRAALSLPIDSGILPYLLSSVIAAYTEPEKWVAVLDLKPTPTPFKCVEVMEQHITAYHQLLAILPEKLLSFCTPTILQTSVDRDSHNSFGLRSLDDDGEEMFGFGIWASASYFNHCCAPTVQKKREGKTWEFWAAKDVEEGEELCITYLGTDTAELDLQERRDRLLETWGFECMCKRCVDESADQSVQLDNEEQPEAEIVKRAPANDPVSETPIQ